MNKFLKISVLSMAMLGLTSCVQDLNTKPIDPNSSTSFNEDRMFTKCYSCMAVIGQSGPGEDSDVEDIDAGTSGFYRTIWYCNELTTDEAWWIWDDAESKQMNQTNWTGTNTMIRAIYTRLNLDIKYCNHYLTYATGTSQEEQYRRAEVRFIRALHYFYLMDMYLYAPHITTESSDYPHFKPRYEIYKWLVQELTELDTELPEYRISKYRVDRAAAELLLARIYLNAAVYNKYNPKWDASYDTNAAYKNAQAMAEKLIGNSNYALVKDNITTDSAFVYTAYQRLFMGDNDKDDVMKESLFQIYQDGLYAQSYASAMMLIGGPRLAGMNAWGIESEWHSFRSSPTLVDKFISPMNIDRTTAAEMKYDEYTMPSKLHDDRAILCSDGLATGYTFKLTGNQDLGDTKYLFDCWAALKFTGVYSSAALPKLSPRQNPSWPDTDIPVLRLAEAYMIKAEAMFRLNDKTGALNVINNDIRARAHADAIPMADFDEETLLDEWCREFYYEGRRRIDLVRFGRFFGPEADQYRYHWEGRMAKPDGAQNYVTGTEEYMNWFPVPSEDKRSNPNYKTDVEGDSNNTFASQGGDGYAY